jgi:tRNA dimethylallyltransferase
MNKPVSPRPQRRRLGVLAGPTASGKTARALEWAAREPVTVINADASQVYRDIPILSAQPGAAEQAQAPHRLFGHRDGARPCSTADWAAEAEAAIRDAWEADRLPLLVGGTGLYLRTLLDGIAPVPSIDPAVRDAVRALPVEQAHAALAVEDPEAAARLHPHDTSRVARALEVRRATGRSLREWQAARTGGLRGEVRLEGEIVTLPVPELHARAERRCAAMWDAGALDEVRRLAARGLSPELPVMRAIGVPQLLAVLAGTSRLDEALAATAQATRRYAKRQRTWFAHQPLL